MKAKEQASGAGGAKAEAGDEDVREIVSTRVFDAPRDALFRAFSDPGQLARWWGPAGFTNSFHEFDLRPGGAWRFVMHGPDGAEYQMVKEFIEVAPPERISLQHVDPVHGFQMTMTFSPVGERTQLVWRMRFESTQEAAAVRALVAVANEQNFDRLAAHLATGK